MSKGDIPVIEWEWEAGGATYGVHTREGKLVWWYRPAGGPDAYRNEMAREQEFEDFIANGASVVAPADVERRLRELIGPKLGS